MASSTLTAAQLKARFPGVGGDLSDAQITALIRIACQISNVSPDALAYLTAHLVVCEREEGQLVIDGGSGVVTSETQGRKTLQIQNMNRDEAEAYYARTHYGRTFLALETRAPKRVFGAMVA